MKRFTIISVFQVLLIVYSVIAEDREIITEKKPNVIQNNNSFGLRKVSYIDSTYPIIGASVGFPGYINAVFGYSFKNIMARASLGGNFRDKNAWELFIGIKLNDEEDQCASLGMIMNRDLRDNESLGLGYNLFFGICFLEMGLVSDNARMEKFVFTFQTGITIRML